jgi:hypothetical protein
VFGGASVGVRFFVLVVCETTVDMDHDVGALK